MTDNATIMRISARSQDALMAVMNEHDDATALDEALRIVLFAWKGYQTMARLAADPRALAGYQAEIRALAESAIDLDEDPYDWSAEPDAPRRRT